MLMQSGSQAGQPSGNLDNAKYKYKRDGEEGVSMEDPYMQITCDDAEKAILAQKKFAEKVRISRQNVNRDKRA